MDFSSVFWNYMPKIHPFDMWGLLQNTHWYSAFLNCSGASLAICHVEMMETHVPMILCNGEECGFCSVHFPLEYFQLLPVVVGRGRRGLCTYIALCYCYCCCFQNENTHTPNTEGYWLSILSVSWRQQTLIKPLKWHLLMSSPRDSL